ncbi:MAG: serine hydrolase [Bacteroidota bacterium]
MSKLYSFLLTCMILVSFKPAEGQDLYFPPENGVWETIDPASLNWCADSLTALQSYLDEKGTKSFIILKDGKIALEWYFDNFTENSLWYWASAGKSLRSMMVGIAQEEGLLNISDSVSQYLGDGWTNCSMTDEHKITIWNQLTMTSGLDDGIVDPHCTDPECLDCIAEPGTRWAYHNGPYTLLTDVLEAASGMTINQYYASRIGDKIGAGGLWIDGGFNNIMWSNARDMARYGLLVLAGGTWDTTPVLTDMDFYNAMINTSQDLNKSYGYLWWLNGKGEYMLPGIQLVIPFDLLVNAPDDMFAALGRDDQKIYVVPSQNLVVIRQGEAAGSILPTLSGFDNTVWAKISTLNCMTTSTSHIDESQVITVFPNPASEYISVESAQNLELLNLTGVSINTVQSNRMDVSQYPPGMYFLRISINTQKRITRKVIIR